MLFKAAVTVFSVIYFIVFLYGVKNYFNRYEPNRCEMTFMYEYPQYVRISFPHNITAQYKRYGLFAYSEGSLTEKARSMKFNGIPVLFIPGNGGSLKQENVDYHFELVRSLASVSLRKSLKSHLPFHFDFFAVDLNEEIMGLYGGYLQEQTKFILYSIQRIFQLYRYKSPDSIVLIGHSMGGLLAKGLFLDPDFDPSWVKLIYTLAAPHKPALLLDSYMASYYEDLTMSPPITTATLVSIGGGDRDFLIQSDLIHDPDAEVSILATQVPDVWLSTDHLSILWCKQLVVVITRSLFDCVDPKTKQITDNRSRREAVMNYHFLSRSAGKNFNSSQHPSRVTLWDGKSKPGVWNEILKRQFSVIYPTGTHELVHVMIRLSDLKDHRILHVLTENHKHKDWIFACRADEIYKDTRLCSTGDNLSGDGNIIPSTKTKQKFVEINMHDFYNAGFSHIILKFFPTYQRVRMDIDIHREKERTIVLESLPEWYLPQLTEVVQKTVPKAIYYRIHLQGLQHIYQAYRLYVNPLVCSKSDHTVVYKFVIPWRNEGSSKAVMPEVESILLKLSSPKPDADLQIDPYVDLILDPECIYNIQIGNSVAEGVAQFSRFFAPLLISSMTTILLVTLQKQLTSLAQNQKCPLVMYALIAGLGHAMFYIFPIYRIVNSLLRWKPEFLNFIPMTDWEILQKSGVDFVILSSSMLMIGFALAFICSICIYISVVISGQTVNKLLLNFLGRFVPSWADWILSGLEKVPIIVSAFMISFCSGACGGLALAVGSVFYFFKVCSLYEEYLEQLLLYPLKIAKRHVVKFIRNNIKINRNQQQVAINDGNSIEGTDDSSDGSHQNAEPVQTIQDDLRQTIQDLPDLLDLTSINYHITLLMLWILGTIIHIPSVLVWAKNYRFSNKLDPDPGLYSATILSACAGILWQGEYPMTNLPYYDELAKAIYLVAFVVFLFTPLSLYRLGPLITFTFLILVLHHLITPWLVKSPTPEPSTTEESLLELDDSVSEPTEITDRSSSLTSLTPEDDFGFKGLHKTLDCISERTEEITEDPSPTASSNQSESDRDLEIITTSKSENGKVTPSSNSELEMLSSNGSLSSFENLSSSELMPKLIQELDYKVFESKIKDGGNGDDDVGVDNEDDIEIDSYDKGKSDEICDEEMK